MFVAANVQEELFCLERDVSHLKNVSLYIFTCKSHIRHDHCGIGEREYAIYMIFIFCRPFPSVRESQWSSDHKLHIINSSYKTFHLVYRYIGTYFNMSCFVV